MSSTSFTWLDKTIVHKNSLLYYSPCSKKKSLICPCFLFCLFSMIIFSLSEIILFQLFKTQSTFTVLICSSLVFAVWVLLHHTFKRFWKKILFSSKFSLSGYFLILLILFSFHSLNHSVFLKITLFLGFWKTFMGSKSIWLSITFRIPYWLIRL